MSMTMPDKEGNKGVKKTAACNANSSACMMSMTMPDKERNKGVKKTAACNVTAQLV